MTKNIKFIDLAGIGGFRYAFEKSGCECVFESEIDEACKKKPIITTMEIFQMET